MRNIGQSMKCMMIAAVLALMPEIASQAAAKPLKVFILAGQSNMQGWFGVSPFDSMADDPKTAPILKEMRDVINAACNLVGTYDQVKGPLWIAQGGFSRGTNRQRTPRAVSLNE